MNTKKIDPAALHLMSLERLLYTAPEVLIEQGSPGTAPISANHRRKALLLGAIRWAHAKGYQGLRAEVNGLAALLGCAPATVFTTIRHLLDSELIERHTINRPNGGFVAWALLPADVGEPTREERDYHGLIAGAATVAINQLAAEGMINIGEPLRIEDHEVLARVAAAALDACELAELNTTSERAAFIAMTHKAMQRLLRVAYTKTLASLDRRQQLEVECRAIADLIRANLPDHAEFVLLLTDRGEKGSFSYVSTVERAGAKGLCLELVGYLDEELRAKTAGETKGDEQAIDRRDLAYEQAARRVYELLPDAYRRHRKVIQRNAGDDAVDVDVAADALREALREIAGPGGLRPTLTMVEAVAEPWATLPLKNALRRIKQMVIADHPDQVPADLAAKIAAQPSAVDKIVLGVDALDVVDEDYRRRHPN